jgi:hypothetical protein
VIEQARRYLSNGQTEWIDCVFVHFADNRLAGRHRGGALWPHIGGTVLVHVSGTVLVHIGGAFTGAY